jgi:hypothetical protein
MDLNAKAAKIPQAPTELGDTGTMLRAQFD